MSHDFTRRSEMITAYIPPTKRWRREVALHFRIIIWLQWRDGERDFRSGV